jgi:hypothetical protein
VDQVVRLKGSSHHMGVCPREKKKKESLGASSCRKTENVLEPRGFHVGKSYEFKEEEIQNLLNVIDFLLCKLMT